MNLTHVRKIWLAALALLALWGAVAWVSMRRLRELEGVAQGRAYAAKPLGPLQAMLRTLSEMENDNRAFLIAPGVTRGRRGSYESRKDVVSEQFKFLKSFYDRAGDRSATALLRRFNSNAKGVGEKGAYNRWFDLSNPNIQKRKDAPDRPGSALLRELLATEAQSTAVLDEARGYLYDLTDLTNKRLANLGVQQQQQRAALGSLFQATIGLGVFGIVGLALMLARQGHKIAQGGEALRRETESRRRAERERQILASHNEQILNSTAEGIVGLNIKGRITFVNPAAASMLGWEVTELLGKPWHDLAQHSRGDNTRLDKDASPVMATLRDANPRRISDDVFWKRTGRTFPVEYAVSPLWELSPRENEERQLAGATLTFRDITERKRSEIALLRLASVVESSKDAILSHLLDGTIVSCNASAVKMYGYSAREMEGQPLSVLLPPSRVNEALLLIEHIARGERIEPYQTTLVGKGGSPIDVAITFYPVLDARGNIMGASSNARPVRRGAGGNLPTFDVLRVSGPANGASSPPTPVRGEVGAAR